ncbi:MAG: hypothetical protein QOD65_2103 [Gaiellales bacterium]|nr:hypothetical protein [Gaiellales bacterium]MDX6599024.1 hypothetical protein [Gaiellales bacterium]
MSSPVDPGNLPLIRPIPPAQPVARRRRSADDADRPPGGRGDQRPREEAGEEGPDDGFPHVDVRV